MYKNLSCLSKCACVYPLCITLLVALGWWSMFRPVLHATVAGNATTPLSESELRVRFGAQSSTDGACQIVGTCNNANNIICQGFNCINPGVDEQCKFANKPPIPTEILYYNPQACRATGPGDHCYLAGSQSYMLCHRWWPCRCVEVSDDVTRCKKPDNATPTVHCVWDDDGLSRCLFQPCPSQ